MKFTKEEKNLCRKIAKKHRKEIEYGDWYYTTEYPEEKYRARIYKYRWTGMADRTINKRKEIIPLWTISDCLEFLREKFFRLRKCSDNELEVAFWLKDECYYGYGKTPHLSKLA